MPMDVEVEFTNVKSKTKIINNYFVLQNNSTKHTSVKAQKSEIKLYSDNGVHLQSYRC